MPTYQEVDYLYISRADCLDNIASIILETSPDNIVYTPIQTITSPLPFVGPREDDVLIRFAPVSSPYFRVRIEYNLSTKTILNKIYLGKLIDFGVMPKTDFEERRFSDRSRINKTTSGKRVLSSNRQPWYHYDISWEGVANSVAAELVDRLPFEGNRYILAVSEDTRGILNSHGVIHGIITNFNVKQTSKELSTVSILFEEMLG
jgi:hypothetical protein